MTHAKVAVLIDEAFVAVQESLSASRTRYLRAFALGLVNRLKASDLEKRHMTPAEGVAMLLAAALTLHMTASPSYKEKE